MIDRWIENTNRQIVDIWNTNRYIDRYRKQTDRQIDIEHKHANDKQL